MFAQLMNAQKISDKLSIGVSLLCVLHCLFFPSFLIIFSSFLSLTLDSELIHYILLFIVVPISIFALTVGLKNHNNSHEGAGEGPTSSSVLSDVVDYAMGIKHHLFNKKYINLSDPASHKNFIERCKYKIALLGGRGYVGQEIIKLLNSHPLFDLSMAFSKSLAVCSY